MDVKYLLGQLNGNLMVAEMVVDEFVKQTPIDIANIEKYIAASELDAAGKVAHSLKGSSGVCGASQLKDLAAELEINCRNNESDNAGSAFQKLKAEVARCLDFIPTLREGLK